MARNAYFHFFPRALERVGSEIHCLVLRSSAFSCKSSSSSLRGFRRRSASPVLHTVVWLAYLSADSVAIFVRGHLAVYVSQPDHQIMSFWAPFMLIHLGGQDTITALSRKDNELWKRHLLILVSQVAVAGYVVAKVSWPDGRLMAAMVLMFLSGCFKYAERTLCLYLASPEKLRSRAVGGLSDTLMKLQETKDNVYPFGLWSRNKSRAKKMRKTLDNIVKGNSISRLLCADESMRDILTADAPLNSARIVSFAEDDLPGMVEWFQFNSSERRCNVYEHVGAILIDFYQDLYTKNPLGKPFVSTSSYSFIRKCVCKQQEPCSAVVCCALCCICHGPFLLYDLFRYVSTPIALVLFWAAEKGDREQLHSRAVIAVSYTLLIGAIVLDVSFATISIFSKYIPLPAAWSKKQWSEELAQYSMIKRHVVQDTAGMASIRQWIGRYLGAWGFDLFELTHTPTSQRIAHPSRSSSLTIC
ncbi:hypothetical protein C2845_PM12G09280 [Panicum miliaceum]|uniref:DUF4220 domain-containing protein n=1 Tax=Panicum miliaceum TaxID=4540 RepID=A0A3L6QKL9_PANMI|nr:hypothetical protein C2845_PM12G09280 [Panicum miliaceum]